ncbi:MAG: hypothetical protein M5R40_29570 [Anaerolineae bacterium]|nr:hypothetical protein [Anaerolineae bacterium]
MPIQGLTSNVSNERDARIGSYVQIGNIRKGKPKTDPKKPGREVDYFRIVPLEGEEEAAAEIFKLYGTDKPKMLRVLLPYDTPRSVLGYLARGVQRRRHDPPLQQRHCGARRRPHRRRQALPAAAPAQAERRLHPGGAGSTSSSPKSTAWRCGACTRPAFTISPT